MTKIAVGIIQHASTEMDPCRVDSVYRKQGFLQGQELLLSFQTHGKRGYWLNPASEIPIPFIALFKCRFQSGALRSRRSLLWFHTEAPSRKAIAPGAKEGVPATAAQAKLLAATQKKAALQSQSERSTRWISVSFYSCLRGPSTCS